jgi:hypothetical protein
MTALDLINKFNKDVWNHSDRMFGDAFDSIFDSWSKAQSFPFYNVVKYGKGEYGLELGLAGYFLYSLYTGQVMIYLPCVLFKYKCSAHIL